MGSPSPFLLLLLFAFSLFGIGAPDLNSDRVALLAFRSRFARAGIPWNPVTSPCSWHGVKCSADNTSVTELRLPGAGLVGRIPAGSIGKLTGLRSLSLRFNHLFGTLPPDFVGLVELRNLFLQGNSFSGPIPVVIFSFGKLVHLSLADNQFNGTIPTAFNSLTHLASLHLEGNKLSGEIPELNNPFLVDFNCSFNELNGSIPMKLSGLPKSDFQGNAGLCGGPLGPCPGEISPAQSVSPPESSLPPASKNSSGSNEFKLSGGAIAGIAIGCAIAFLLLLLLLVFCCCRRSEKSKAWPAEAASKQPEAEITLRDKRGVTENGEGAHAAPAPVPAVVVAAVTTPSVAGGPKGSSKNVVFLGKTQRIYNLEDLLRASAEVLGKGTSGTTYKAMLEMGMVVAVKRLKDMNLPEKEFRERINFIGSMDHPNLVTLQAYYYNKDEKLVVYDFVPNGSLSALLHGNKGSGRNPLDWETRLNLSLGAARGIEYIHLRGSGFSHGNIKSSNVLLSRSCEALVSDSGLCSIGSTITPSRTAGYRAPEVTDVRRVTQKADVYSFGVLLLELLTGKAPAQAIHNDNGVDLPRWVQSVVQEEWTSEVFDLQLLRYQNVEEEMVQLLQLALDCVSRHPERRPSMSEVVGRIEEIRRSSLRDQLGQDGNAFDLNSIDGSRPPGSEF